MARSVVFADDFEGAGTVQTLFRSFGTDATGTLNAWLQETGNVATIAANVVTMPVSSGIYAGHLDWGDVTIQARFKWTTNSSPCVKFRRVDASNYGYALFDGANIRYGTVIAGNFGNEVSIAAALVNGTQYWLQVICTGSSFTVKVFADNAGAINLASQVGSTANSTGPQVVPIAGQITLGTDVGGGAAGTTFGGAFANVCLVTGPVPTGWLPSSNWAIGEPAFAWSKSSPFSGIYSVSIFTPVAMSITAQYFWRAPLPSGGWPQIPLTLFAQMKQSAALLGYIQFNPGGGGEPFVVPLASWQAVSQITTPGVGAGLFLGLSHDVAGTLYFDNLALFTGTPVVAQPTIIRSGSTGHSIAKFGGAALPNGQGFMPQVDLNDYANALLGWLDNGRQIGLDESNRQIGLDQLLYRARAAYTSDDFGPRPYSLPMTYIEDSTHFLGGLLAALSQAGEQQLTFDNATYAAVKYKGISGRATSYRFRQPLAWDFTLELIAAEPWFKDLLASALVPLTLTVDAGQAFVIPYQGTVRCDDPIWTLVVPASNGVAINSMVLTNLMTGEALTVNFLSYLAIPASTLRTITIDCGANTVVDDLGHAYDISGTFPKLYPANRQPPVDQFNPFNVALTPASGSTSGLTLAASYVPRWQL
jgi:hypothetical protein